MPLLDHAPLRTVFLEMRLRNFNLEKAAVNHSQDYRSGSQTIKLLGQHLEPQACLRSL